MATFHINPDQLTKLDDEKYQGIIKVGETKIEKGILIYEVKDWFAINGVLTKIFEN